jgi:hypothetical protein
MGAVMKLSRNVMIGAALAVVAGIGIGFLIRSPKANSADRQARRSVKTTTDVGAAQIDLTIKDTTIEELIKARVPQRLGERAGPFETTVWRVHGKIQTIEKKKDGDYYLVMRGEKGGQTVVEVPDPKECKGSPIEKEIEATRKELEAKYHPTSEKKEVNEDAVVTGVGFLGWGTPAKSGSTGISGPRLMPGTSVSLGQK